MVIMKATANPDGSLTRHSAGQRFGDPGFYFTLHDANGLAHTRYVKSMQESIHVFAAEPGIFRADNLLHLWGLPFLRLHYRMRRSA